MQSAFKELQLIFKDYLRHMEEQSNKQRKVRQVQQYCEMSFSEPVDQLRARSLRGNSDGPMLKVSKILPEVDQQKYVKQEWNTVFPIVTQLRFEILDLSGIPKIMMQIKNIHLFGLKSLTLSQCHIQSIQSLHFMHLNVLKELNLSQNAITSLKSLRKISSPGLERLNVSTFDDKAGGNCLVSLQFIEQIKMSKHMRQIIIQANMQEYCSGQSINCLWKIQSKTVRFIRFKFFIQDLNQQSALMPCIQANANTKDFSISADQTQNQFFNDYQKDKQI